MIQTQTRKMVLGESSLLRKCEPPMLDPLILTKFFKNIPFNYRRAPSEERDADDEGDHYEDPATLGSKKIA